MSPERVPAARIGSLEWKTGADLDLLVVGRDGRTVAATTCRANSDVDDFLQVFDASSRCHQGCARVDMSAGLLAGGAEEEFLTISTDGVIRSTIQGTTQEVSKTHTEVRGLAGDADATTLAWWHEGSVCVWDRVGDRHRTFRVRDEIVATAALNGDGSVLAILYIPNTVVLRDVQSGRELLQTELKGKCFEALEFSSDGRQLAIGGDARTARCLVFSVRIEGDRAELGNKRTYRGHVPIALSPNQDWLAVTHDEYSVKLHSLRIARRERTSPRYRDYVRALAFSPDGSRLFFGGAAGILRNWPISERFAPEVPTNEPLHAIEAIAFAPGDPNILAVAGADNSVGFWDLSSAAGPSLLSATSFDGGQVTAIDYSADGKTLAVGCENVRRGEAPLLLLGGGEPVRVGRTDCTVYHVASHPSRPLLAVVQRMRRPTPSRVLLLDTSDRKNACDIRMLPELSPYRCCWTSGDTLAVGFGDGQIGIFAGPQYDDGRYAAACDGGIRSMVYIAEADMLVLGDEDGRMHLWNPGSHQTTKTVQAHEGYVNDIEVVPGGAAVATCGSDGRVCLWTSESLTLQREYLGHWGDVKTLAISADGRRLASGGSDTTVAIWNLNRGR